MNKFVQVIHDEAVAYVVDNLLQCEPVVQEYTLRDEYVAAYHQWQFMLGELGVPVLPIEDVLPDQYDEW